MKNLFFLLLFLVFQHVSAQDFRYVKVDGVGDGTSWSSASGDLQAMINTSESNDEIWVGAGVYKPVRPINDPLIITDSLNSRLSSFTMKSGVKLYGGFPDSGTPGFAERDTDSYETILSGDIGIVDDSADNSYHVCFFPNTDNAVLDGFTIQDGHANASSFNYLVFVPSLNMQIPNYNGGGMYMEGGNNQIYNCKIINNQSLLGGGGVYCNSGTHEFVNNHFAGNFGRAAGGALLINTGEYILTSNVFLNNEVVLGINYPFPMPSPGNYASGAGVSATNANVNFDFNHFENNHASVNNSTTNARGGAIFLSSGTHTIHNNSFAGNSATYLPEGVQVCSGGAVYIESAHSEIVNCQFFENLSHGSGGALYMLLGTHQVIGSRFHANQSIGNGGAIVCASISANIVNNIFDFNFNNANGAAIHSAGNAPGGANFYINNTFYKNATTLNQAAAGISLDGGLGHVINNIFYGNSSDGGTTASGADFQFYNASGSSFLYNMYQSGISYPEQGIIGNDANNNPLFVDADNGDFTLTSESACIGTGSNEHYLEAYPDLDFLGNGRIQNGTIDLGAVEYQDLLSNRAAVDKTPSVWLYPNPAVAGEVITVRTEQFEVFLLLDVTGNTLDTFTFPAGEHTLVLNQPQGIYFLKSGKGETVKLIVY